MGLALKCIGLSLNNRFVVESTRFVIESTRFVVELWVCRWMPWIKLCGALRRVHAFWVPAWSPHVIRKRDRCKLKCARRRSKIVDGAAQPRPGHLTHKQRFSSRKATHVQPRRRRFAVSVDRVQSPSILEVRSHSESRYFVWIRTLGWKYVWSAVAPRQLHTGFHFSDFVPALLDESSQVIFYKLSILLWTIIVLWSTVRFLMTKWLTNSLLQLPT